MFLNKKDKKTGQKLFTFPSSNIELAQMILGQSHVIPTGKMQSLYKVRISTAFPYKIYRSVRNNALFHQVILYLLKMTLGQDNEIS